MDYSLPSLTSCAVRKRSVYLDRLVKAFKIFMLSSKTPQTQSCLRCFRLLIWTSRWAIWWCFIGEGPKLSEVSPTSGWMADSVSELDLCIYHQDKDWSSDDISRGSAFPPMYSKEVNFGAWMTCISGVRFSTLISHDLKCCTVRSAAGQMRYSSVRPHWKCAVKGPVNWTVRQICSYNTS